jgi:hypothetical protein
LRGGQKKSLTGKIFVQNNFAGKLFCANKLACVTKISIRAENVSFKARRANFVKDHSDGKPITQANLLIKDEFLLEVGELNAESTRFIFGYQKKFIVIIASIL